MFTFEQLKWILDNSNEICPVCIPSYKRWDRDKNKTITKIIEKCDEEIQRNTYVFVRKEQASAYSENFKSVNIVVLPEVRGLAGTRQYICDFVSHDLRKQHFVDMDDDITVIKAAVLNADGKPGLSKVGEIDMGKMLRFGYAISKMAFDIHNCVIGSMRRAHFGGKFEDTQTAYIVNKGATPRQVVYHNVEALNRMGVRRNLCFDINGDDVGFVAEITKRRGSMFNIPCLAYDYVDDAVNSVIRNDSNRKMKANWTYECLKKYPMARFLRVPFRFNDGSPKFCDIDFAKYREISGLRSYALSLGCFYYMKKKELTWN